MKLKKTLLAVLAGSAALAAAPAFADRDGRDHDRGWHHGHQYRPHYVQPRVVYVPPPRVVYYQAGAYYTPPPVVYPPAPVYYSAPVYRAPEPGVSIRFRLPL